MKGRAPLVVVIVILSVVVVFLLYSNYITSQPFRRPLTPLEKAELARLEDEDTNRAIDADLAELQLRLFELEDKKSTKAAEVVRARLKRETDLVERMRSEGKRGREIEAELDAHKYDEFKPSTTPH